jgi:hypothetical protein
MFEQTVIHSSSKRPLLTIAAVVVSTTAAWFAFADAALAEDSSFLAVYAGFRDGGSFTDAQYGHSVEIQSSATAAVSFDFPAHGQQLQIFFSYQDSQLALGPSNLSPTPYATRDFPLRVMYLHVGGPVFFGEAPDHGPYAVGGIGATLFDPPSGYSSELRFSANLGIGYHYPIGDRMALRVEARGYFTFVNSSGGLFCNGGCTIAISGNSVVQGELSVGLAFRL